MEFVVELPSGMVRGVLRLNLAIATISLFSVGKLWIGPYLKPQRLSFKLTIAS
jgi:hypothetical protein